MLAPVARAYRAALPAPVRGSVHDFLNNLGEPLIFANDTLQGDFDRAKDTVVRFVLNSTLGMAGLVDVAGRWGIPYHAQDLGVTSACGAFPRGPIWCCRCLGPSDPRDLGGEVAEGFGDPWNRLVTGNPFTLYWIRSRGARSPASISARAISMPWLISSGHRSIITRRSARSTGSAARR